MDRRYCVCSLFTRTLLALLLAAGLAAAPAWADTHHWNGDGDGVSWSDPDNWLEDAVPATTSDGESADDVEIDGAYTVYMGSDVSAIHNLTIDNDALLVVESGVTLKLQQIEITDGGIELEDVAGTGATIQWSKTNRGHLYVESDGYITGTGLIHTMANSAGVRLMSTRSADFDMTNITLKIDYQEPLWVCSTDQGRDDTSDWSASNFTIGKIIFDDSRYSHGLYEADGTTGGDTNALYCLELEFTGSWDKTDGAQIDLQGTNLYVRDKVTWFDDTYTDTAGQLTVATAYDNLDVTTSIWDDDTTAGEAYIGTPPNTAPTADAGSDQTVTDTDDSGAENVTLDGSGSTDSDGSIASYLWEENSSQIATGVSPTVSFSVATHTVNLTVTDDDGATDSDSVVITVNPDPNDAPVVDAGYDATITLPANANLDATVTDDGKPVPASLTTAWTKVSGTGDVTFADSTAVDTMATFTAAGTYVLQLQADDGDLTDSDTVTITVNAATGGAITSTTTWQNASITSQSDGFTAEFDMVPHSALMDGVTGISNGSADAYDDLACIVRLNNSGYIDARDGGVYAKDADIQYAVGSSYAVRLEIDLSTHTYDVFVTPSGGSETQIANDFDFRTQQASVTSLDTWSVHCEWGAHTVSNMTITPHNQAPTADAGSDISITLGQVAHLDGTVTDDGKPTPANLTTTWTMSSGPGTVTFTDAAAVDTDATFSIDGTYVLQLEADDSALTATDTVTVTVAPHVVGTHHWTGDGDGSSWNDPDNWLEDAVPMTIGIGDGADSAEIDGVYDVTVTSDVISVAAITIDGNATLTIASGVTLKTNSLDIIDGGLILAESQGVGANLGWGKAARGHLYVEANGYIAGTGTVQTATSGLGVRIKSTDSTNFDMTAITLQMAYGEPLWVASADQGGLSSTEWNASNFAIGKLYLSDRRFTTDLFEIDGTAGGDTNALYCLELQFYGDADESANLDLQGINLYVRDKITWGDGTTLETDGEVTVATAPDGLVKTTAIWDDDTPQAKAYLGVRTNTAPSVDAGLGDTIHIQESVSLDGTVTDDGLPLSPGAVTTTWTKVTGAGTVTFTDSSAVDTTATFSAADTYVLQLEGDDGALTATDTVTVKVTTYDTGTHYWSGDGDGSSWSDADNWYEDTVPTTTSDGEGADNIVIQGRGEVAHVDADVLSVNTVTIDGDATLVIDAGIELKLQKLNIVDGGLELAESAGSTGYLNWAKANRGHLWVEADGYIAGEGEIRTLTNSEGVRLKSTRSADFDMTGITLRIAYQEPLWVCSADNGRAESTDWSAANFTIGKLIFNDYRYAHLLCQADGTDGDGTNALYCHEIQFGGSTSDGGRMDLQGINVYIRDKVTWFDGTYTDTAGQLTVASAYDNQDVTTSLYDDNTTPGSAYVGPASVNSPPTADAGADQTVTDTDLNGSESVTLDGTGSTDSDGSITSYDWTEGGSSIATGSSPSVTLAVGTHTITLTVTDNESATDTDTVVITVDGYTAVSQLPLTNRQSGISISLSGTIGTDYAVEQLYHDMAVGDQLIYLKSSVDISLAHNANNTIMKRDTVLPGIIGVDGPDGVADSGDEGDIHYKIDRDMQSHRYNGGTSTIPTYAPLYSSAFDFDSLTYDGTTDVLGTTGDNNGAYGTSPLNTTARFAYGQTDAYGNEWHTLTYWDDDEAIYTANLLSSHRQGASDGHWVYICVNPVTPIVQFSAPTGEEFYTTPIKTYHVPKTWEQTTYLTGGVEIQFTNLTNTDPVYYRVDGGTWTQFGSVRLVADDIFTSTNTEITLEFRNGTTGAIGERTIVMDPSTPAASETHGYMLWPDSTAKTEMVYKLKNTQPFAYSYNTLAGEYYQNSTTSYTDARDGWRSGAGMASTAMANAFVVTVDGVSTKATQAAICKERLLRMARLEAVGFENGVSNATPSKDYLNELGQTIQQFADAGVAYDMLAACYRDTDATGGMTPIEELRIRDGLAEIAKTILQFRSEWSFVAGSGDTHWAHGYELAIGTLALAMPTYSTPYFGVSGGDLTSTNTYSDANGEYWNPFPNLGVTWYEAVTDPDVSVDGYPDIKAPLRSEAQISDDGYWTGPNYLQGDGDRYVDGPMGSRLADIKSGGLANAENRVELVEMSGYESPFATRIQALTIMRKIAGDSAQQTGVLNYMRRRLLHGYIPLTWDDVNLRYTKEDPRVDSSLVSFNNQFDWAGSTPAVNLVDEFLTNVNRYYGYETGDYPSHISTSRKGMFDVYVLAACADPDDINTPVGDANHTPVIKPAFKYVVEPGDTVHKELIASDLDGDSVTLSVSNLPSGATYSSSTETITWTTQTGDDGVYIVSITASDGTASVTRPFPIIVKSDAGDGPIPSAPTSVTGSLTNDDATISWTAPSGVTVANYIIYRDGAIHDVVSSSTTSYTDYDLPAGSHTQYHVSVIATTGAESSAVATSPNILSISSN